LDLCSVGTRCRWEGTPAPATNRAQFDDRAIRSPVTELPRKRAISTLLNKERGGIDKEA